MSKFEIEMSCPECGGDLELITQSLAAHFTRDRRAVMSCVATGCRFQWLVAFEILPAFRDEEAYATKCGTEAGYQRHRRNGVEPCDACKASHIDKTAEFKRQQRQLVNR